MGLPGFFFSLPSAPGDRGEAMKKDRDGGDIKTASRKRNFTIFKLRKRRSFVFNPEQVLCRRLDIARMGK